MRSQRVPARLTRFFGRSAEVERIAEQLGEARLVTLVGAPGVGKTRLAVELGGDGRFVALASVGEPGGVPAAFASVLGFAQETGSTITDMITEKLADSETLLVVDNCEHVAPAVADLAHRLLQDCPGTRVLATSRVPLGVAGERLFRVSPLDADAALALFIDRAEIVRPGSEPDDAERRDAERICRRLDRIPLAIELVAAWNRVLTPIQILHRLDSVLPMLTSTDSVGRDQRQRTMEATVAWSHRLLTPAQQELFERLSVFSGGFDFDAAESVAGAEGLLVDLTALVDHSLVLADPTGGAMRYRLLEPVREFGESTLARRVGEPDRTRARHAETYLRFARRCDVGLRRGDRSRHLREMCREEGNLFAALAWTRRNDLDEALQLATAVAYFCELRGLVNDGRAWLSELLESGAGDEQTRGQALARLGRLAWRQWDNDCARKSYEECLLIARELGDATAVASGLRNLALVECAVGNSDRARELCAQSITLHAQQGDDLGQGWAWTVLGLAEAAAARWSDCDRACRRALEVDLAQPSAALEATARLGIAFAAANTGDAATHRSQLRVVLAGIREVQGLVDDPDWLWAASALAVNEGRFRAGLRLAGAARAVGARGSNMPSTMMDFCESAVRRGREALGGRCADRLAAQGTAMTAEQLIAEASAEPTDADRPPSRREREVAELVGDGLTNEQIATELVVSRRTVESHVESLKRKLDLGGRNEIMAWVLARRFEEGHRG